MRQGVSGFIYYSDNLKHFNDNDDEIEEYLSDWYHDTLGVDNYMREICNDTNPCSIQELKSNMVWQYVELKALDILCEIKHPDFY